MKKLFILIPILFSFLIGTSQDISVNIKTQAEKMVTAFQEQNFSGLLDYTYPKIVEIAGGKEIMESLVKQVIISMQDQGVYVDSATVGEPGLIVTAGSELHSTIEQKVYMRFNGGKMISESTLLAISQDAGINWYFLDVKQLTPEMRTQLFPDFNPELIIPEPKPVITTYDEK